MKRWEIKKPDSQKVDEILRKSDLTSLCAEVLVSRGYDNMKILINFFNDDELSDPMTIKDMPNAVEVISREIEILLSPKIL